MKNGLLLMLLLGAAALILFAFDKVAKRYKAEHSKWATAFMCAVLAALFAIIFVWDRAEGGGFSSSLDIVRRR
jgi:hypothetical protein